MTFEAFSRMKVSYNIVMKMTKKMLISFFLPNNSEYKLNYNEKENSVKLFIYSDQYESDPWWYTIPSGKPAPCSPGCDKMSLKWLLLIHNNPWGLYCTTSKLISLMVIDACGVFISVTLDAYPMSSRLMGAWTFASTFSFLQAATTPLYHTDDVLFGESHKGPSKLTAHLLWKPVDVSVWAEVFQDRFTIHRLH